MDAAGLGFSVEPPAPQRCPLELLKNPTEADFRKYARDDPRCGRNPGDQNGIFSGYIVDDGAALPVLTGTPAADAVAALRAGKAVVFDDYLVAPRAHDGTGVRRFRRRGHHPLGARGGAA